MASSFGKKIDGLRKRSRALLTSLEENSRFVESQVKKLRLRNSSVVAVAERRRLLFGRNSELWKLRNDSSGVGAALCPDYFRPTPRYESHSSPDMSHENVKLVITSSKRQPKPLPVRKPIRECYCYPEVRRVQYRSLRTRHKPIVPCNSCRSHCHLVASHSPESLERARSSNHVRSRSNFTGNGNGDTPRSPALSIETVRMAQKIDYTPRSQFLRNVQSKVSSLRRSTPRYPSEPSARSPSPLLRRFNSCGDSPGRNSVPWTTTSGDKSSKIRDRERGGTTNKSCQCGAKEVQVPSQKTSKSRAAPKKTISSKKSAMDQRRERPVLRSPPRNKRIVRIVTKDCPCCGKLKDLGKDTKHPADRDPGKFNVCPGYCKQTNWVLERGRSDGDITDDSMDKELNDVHKFREQNYFDTHGSSQTLLASRSSGSLCQFRLNERLFPEPVGRVHREDLVVTMPPCTTKQRKSIHYFPRGVVKQEKTICNTNYSHHHQTPNTKRRCQNCPLTGHAVDLGVLKVCHPPNSLALRYQKGVP